MENVKLAPDVLNEYVEAVREKFGCRAINEKLYVPFLLAEEEIDQEKQREKNLPAPFDVLKGDLREQPIETRPSIAMHKKDKSFTFRTGSAVEAAVAVATAATTTAAATNTTNNNGGTFIPPTPQSRTLGSIKLCGSSG